jgi:hypothetical protein
MTDRSILIKRRFARPSKILKPTLSGLSFVALVLWTTWRLASLESNYCEAVSHHSRNLRFTRGW